MLVTSGPVSGHQTMKHNIAHITQQPPDDIHFSSIVHTVHTVLSMVTRDNRLCSKVCVCVRCNIHLVHQSKEWQIFVDRSVTVDLSDNVKAVKRVETDGTTVVRSVSIGCMPVTHTLLRLASVRSAGDINSL